LLRISELSHAQKFKSSVQVRNFAVEIKVRLPFPGGLHNEVFILLPTLPLLTLLYTSIDDEEAMLAARFGDEYRQYMKRTPRFIPKSIHSHSPEQRKQPP
jgi:hypothetical protein